MALGSSSKNICIIGNIFISVRYYSSLKISTYGSSPSSKLGYGGYATVEPYFIPLTFDVAHELISME